jgi:aspartyl-tRNA(Asn)/glutamyl-tRNA(Gln) amidotransferase subunit A
MKSQILQINNALKNHQLSISQLVENCVSLLKNITKTNSIITTCYDAAATQAALLDADLAKHDSDLLYGIPYAMKDNVSTKGVKTTAGSKFLQDYIPPYDATIAQKLNSAQALMLCKSNLDEYGLGGTGTFSAFGIVKNVHDAQYTTGGSSSGSANLVASGAVPFAIGTDTGDSIRRPASLMGIVGYKPTYGIISRYGVIPYAPSFDHVGVLSQYVADAAIVASAIVGHDPADYTSQKITDANFFTNLCTLKQINFVCLKNIENYMDEDVKKLYLEAIKKISQIYHVKVVEPNLEIIKAISPAYMVLTYAEASSCHANKQGVTFGPKSKQPYQAMLLENRTNNFGEQLKRRFTIGAYVTSAENFEPIFQRTKKIRTLIINEANRLLAAGDCLIIPAASAFAPKIDDVVANKSKTTIADDCLQFANFAGTPSITIPYKQGKFG